MNEIIPGRWHIPLPADAICEQFAAGDDGRLDRLAALEEGRLAESMAFLCGYAPGIFDAILTATEPCTDDDYPSGEDALEPFCTTCGAHAGVFTALGMEWRHYRSSGKPAVFDPGHAPVIGWRTPENMTLV